MEYFRYAVPWRQHLLRRCHGGPNFSSALCSPKAETRWWLKLSSVDNPFPSIRRENKQNKKKLLGAVKPCFECHCPASSHLYGSQARKTCYPSRCPGTLHNSHSHFTLEKSERERAQVCMPHFGAYISLYMRPHAF